MDLDYNYADILLPLIEDSIDKNLKRFITQNTIKVNDLTLKKEQIIPFLKNIILNMDYLDVSLSFSFF